MPQKSWTAFLHWWFSSIAPKRNGEIKKKCLSIKIKMFLSVFGWAGKNEYTPYISPGKDLIQYWKFCETGHWQTTFLISAFNYWREGALNGWYGMDSGTPSRNASLSDALLLQVNEHLYNYFHEQPYGWAVSQWRRYCDLKAPIK